MHILKAFTALLTLSNIASALPVAEDDNLAKRDYEFGVSETTHWPRKNHIGTVSNSHY